MTNIVIAENHQLVREGIQAILDQVPFMDVIGTTGDGLSVEEMVVALQPHVLILDLLLPGLHGLEVLRRVRGRMPDLRVIVLTMYDHVDYVKRAFRMGAMAYITKDAGISVMKEAIEAVMAGRRFLDPVAAKTFDLEEIRAESEEADLDPYDFLTDREREALQLMAEGLTLKESAARLHISPRTIEKHRSSFMQKLDLHNQIEVVRYAIFKGLVGPPPPKP